MLELSVLDIKLIFIHKKDKISKYNLKLDNYLINQIHLIDTGSFLAIFGNGHWLELRKIM
jgi:hypothetical protein